MVKYEMTSTCVSSEPYRELALVGLRGWGFIRSRDQDEEQRVSVVCVCGWGGECPNILGNRSANHGCPFIHRPPCLGTHFLCRTEPGQQRLTAVPGDLDTVT